MITGALAIIINMMTIMALGILIAVVVVSIYYKYSIRNQAKYSAKTYQLILWTLVLLPWLVGLVTAVILAFFDPMLISIQGVIPNISNIHWHHIDEFDFYSWHAVLAVIIVVFTFFALAKSFVSLINSVNKINTLSSLAKSKQKNTYLLDTNNPMAFTGGYFQPKVFVTTGLQSSVSVEEMEIILIHEYEHVRNKDTLKKLIFNFLSSVFPSVISIKLEASMNLTMEQCADLVVVQKQYDKSKIAKTMLKVNKMLSQLSQTQQFNLNKSSVCHYGLDEIEHRIKYLFNKESNKRYPIYFVFTLLTVLSFSGIYFASSTHHFIEHILSFSD